MQTTNRNDGGIAGIYVAQHVFMTDLTQSYKADSKHIVAFFSVTLRTSLNQSLLINRIYVQIQIRFYRDGAHISPGNSSHPDVSDRSRFNGERKAALPSSTA